MYCRILSKREANLFWLKISETCLYPSIAYLGVLIELYTTKVLMIQKGNLAAVGFEPTPPMRLVPKTSALDHSATLPDAISVGPRQY